MDNLTLFMWHNFIPRDAGEAKREKHLPPV